MSPPERREVQLVEDPKVPAYPKGDDRYSHIDVKAGSTVTTVTTVTTVGTAGGTRRSKRGCVQSEKNIEFREFGVGRLTLKPFSESDPYT